MSRSAIRLLETEQARELRREFPIVYVTPDHELARAYALGVAHGKAMQVAIDLETDTVPDLNAGGSL